MGRFTVLIPLVLGGIFLVWALLGKKEEPQKPETKTAKPEVVASPTPVFRVKLEKMDHGFGDRPVSSSGGVYQRGRVVEEGVVIDVHDNRARVLGPDGLPVVVGLGADVPSREKKSMSGAVWLLDANGQPFQMESVIMTDGEVYRIGRGRREGMVEDIRAQEVFIRRGDGGLHIVSFGSARARDMREPDVLAVMQTNSAMSPASIISPN